MTLFVICFISQRMKRSKHGLFVFPPKITQIWRRHCSISQSCCSMTSKRSIGWFLESFSRERSLNQPKATRVCIRSIDQSDRSISVRLLFLFCSRVFISRSYENSCNIKEKSCTVCQSCKTIKCKIFLPVCRHPYFFGVPSPRATKE